MPSGWRWASARRNSLRRSMGINSRGRRCTPSSLRPQPGSGDGTYALINNEMVRRVIPRRILAHTAARSSPILTTLASVTAGSTARYLRPMLFGSSYQSVTNRAGTLTQARAQSSCLRYQLFSRSISSWPPKRPSGADQSGDCRFKSEIERKARQDSAGVDTVARDTTKLAARDHPDCLTSVHDR
jgi:hypothetical protein